MCSYTIKGYLDKLELNKKRNETRREGKLMRIFDSTWHESLNNTCQYDWYLNGIAFIAEFFFVLEGLSDFDFEKRVFYYFVSFISVIYGENIWVIFELLGERRAFVQGIF